MRLYWVLQLQRASSTPWPHINYDPSALIPLSAAGVVGAVGNNKIGVTGVSQRVEIVTCQFMDATGNGWVSDAVQCIDYCITEDAHIMSNSWGGVAPSDALTVGRLAVCWVLQLHTVLRLEKMR